jgi:antitoxin (DNA-binding transcriptional repressor) of toxin-antitoxin stability system
MSAEQSEQPEDLGFRYRVRKGGEVELTHRGRLAATLRGNQAAEFLAEAPDPTDPKAQQLMARLTGNYKRGNERQASNHPRNRR